MSKLRDPGDQTYRQITIGTKYEKSTNYREEMLIVKLFRFSLFPNKNIVGNAAINYLFRSG